MSCIGGILHGMGSADSVERLAFRLLTLGCEFEAHEPPELVDHLREVARRAGRAAGQEETDGGVSIRSWLVRR